MYVKLTYFHKVEVIIKILEKYKEEIEKQEMENPKSEVLTLYGYC